MISFQPGNVMAWLLLGVVVLRLLIFGSKKCLILACIIGLISLFIMFFYPAMNASKIDPKMDFEPRTVLLEVNPNRMRVNGDQLSGEATLQWNDTDEKVVYYYKIKTEEEKIQWEQLEEPQNIVAVVSFEKPEAERNLFQFDYAGYLEQKKIHWIVTIQTIEHMEENQSLWRYASIFRRKIILMLEGLPSPKVSGYIQTMLFNQQHTIAGESLESYREIGLLHLFSISGMHIQLFIFQIRFVLLRLRITHEATNKILVLFLMGYGLFTGWSVGIFRAVCTHVILLIGKICQHHIEAKDAFAVTILLAVWMNPATIYTASFQLSYLLSGVLYFIASASSKWKLHPILKDMFLTLIMTVVSFPILSYHFFEVSWMGVFVNVVFSLCFSWLLFPLFWTLFCAVFLFSDSGLLNIFAGIAEKNLDFLEDFARICADFRIFQTITGRPSMPYFFLIGFFILIFLIKIEQDKKSYPALIGAVLAIFVFSSSVYLHPSGKVIMLDVGQGDSFLFITPFQRKTILIDTGGTTVFGKEDWQMRETTATSGKKLLSAIKAEGVRKLDMVFLTHADSDHVGSLLELSQGIEIKEVYFAKGTEQNEALKKVLLELQSSDVLLFPILGKQEVTIDVDLTFRILAPIEAGEGGNEDSLVIFTQIAGLSWLFTGDLGEEGERGLLMTYPLLKADVLKVGHHGSLSSSSETFLDRIQPEIALISVGDGNAYGHPNSEILERLNKGNIRIFRTDQQGAVHFSYGSKESEWYTILTKEKFK